MCQHRVTLAKLCTSSTHSLASAARHVGRSSVRYISGQYGVPSLKKYEAIGEYPSNDPPSPRFPNPSPNKTSSPTQSILTESFAVWLPRPWAFCYVCPMPVLTEYPVLPLLSQFDLSVFSLGVLLCHAQTPKSIQAHASTEHCSTPNPNVVLPVLIPFVKCGRGMQSLVDGFTRSRHVHFFYNLRP